MERNDPFYILLDSYKEECEELYNKVLGELELQAKANSTHEQIQIDLRKAAFAYLCMEFLHETIGMYSYEDFELFLEEVGFKNKSPYFFYLLGREGIEWSSDFEIEEVDEDEEDTWWREAFNEMMFELIQKHKNWWSSEIRRHYISDKEIIKLFGQNIFKDPLLDSEGMYKFYGFVSENF